MRLAGGENKIVAGILLQHLPHSVDVFRGVTPIAFCVEVAEKQFLLQSVLDGGDGPGNFAGNKGLAAPRTFVVEQDGGTGVKSVAFTVVYGCPVGKNFRDTVGTARPEWCPLCLRDFLYFAIHLAARGLVKTRANASLTDRFQNSDGSDTCHIRRVFGNIKADANVALCPEMINFIRLQIIKQLHQINGVSKIPIVEKKADAVDVRVDV